MWITEALLTLIIPSVIALALAVDVAAVIGWLRRCAPAHEERAKRTDP